MNKTRWMWIGTAIVATVLVLALAGATAWVVGRHVWGGIVQAQGSDQPGPFGWNGRGPMGMMGRYWPGNSGTGSNYDMPCLAPSATLDATGEALFCETDGQCPPSVDGFATLAGTWSCAGGHCRVRVW